MSRREHTAKQAQIHVTPAVFDSSAGDASGPGSTGLAAIHRQ